MVMVNTAEMGTPRRPKLLKSRIPRPRFMPNPTKKHAMTKTVRLDAWMIAPVFMIYMLLFLRSSVETGAIIQASNRTVFVMACFFVGFGMNLGLGILLFKSFGRLGVPISAVFTMTMIGVVTLVYSARLVKVSVFKLFPTAELIKRFLAAALPGAVLWLAYKKFPVTNFLQLLAACAIYTLMYAIVCYVTKIVTFDDVRAMFGRSPAQQQTTA